jgi:hypothetical protein
MIGRQSEKRMNKDNSTNGLLPNSAIAELLAVVADDAKMPLQALRRASRKAFMWGEEAHDHN